MNRHDTLKTAHCYVDGSHSNNIYTYAFAHIDKETVLYEDKGKGENFNAVKTMGCQAGELKAAMQATLYAAKQNYKSILIYYDNLSIELLFTKEYKPKNIFTKKYVEFMEKIQNNFNIEIRFKKVKGHSGDKFNDYVDKLAKEALYEALEEKENSYTEEEQNETPQEKPFESESEKRRYNELNNMLIEIHPYVLVNSHELKWYGIFLLDVYQRVRMKNKISPKQEEYIRKGYQIVKRKYIK